MHIVTEHFFLLTVFFSTRNYLILIEVKVKGKIYSIACHEGTEGK